MATSQQRDRGAFQRADDDGNKLDRGAVEIFVDDDSSSSSSLSSSSSQSSSSSSSFSSSSSPGNILSPAWAYTTAVKDLFG